MNFRHFIGFAETDPKKTRLLLVLQLPQVKWVKNRMENDRIESPCAQIGHFLMILTCARQKNNQT